MQNGQKAKKCSHLIELLVGLGPELIVSCLTYRDSTVVFFLFLRFSVSYLAPGDLHHRTAY